MAFDAAAVYERESCQRRSVVDVIITETGTSAFGLINVPLPSHSTYVAQVLWGSIGWAVGATLGCALAATEEKHHRRTILFEGDGSLQLVRGTLRSFSCRMTWSRIR